MGESRQEEKVGEVGGVAKAGAMEKEEGVVVMLHQCENAKVCGRAGVYDCLLSFD